MASGQTITLRLTIEDPCPGETYSLQNAKSVPVGQVVATEAPLSFEVPVLVRPGPKLAGDFVRREGAVRRFIYIAIGKTAGDAAAAWSRRAKIDVHDISKGLLDKTLSGAALECRLPGRAKDGGPACATVRPLDGWHLAASRGSRS